MRDVDERVSAVQGRVRRMKRKRERTMVGALATMAVLVCAVLVSVPVVTEQTESTSGSSTLFGAASLFGPSIGGYVLVAIVTAVVVALITAFFMMRRKKDDVQSDSEGNADGN